MKKKKTKVIRERELAESYDQLKTIDMAKETYGDEQDNTVKNKRPEL